MEVLTMRARIRRGRVAAGRRLAWLVALAWLGLAAPGALAQTATSAEYQLKAVFLFDFAQFVEWPARAFPDPKAPLLIGILGKDPFGAYLDDLVRGERIGDRPLLVRRGKRAEDLADCQIVFIGRSETREMEGIIARLKGRSLLTVSDADDFTRHGGMVRFVMEDGKIRLRINVEAAKACGLIISSKILRPGTIVTSGRN